MKTLMTSSALALSLVAAPAFGQTQQSQPQQSQAQQGQAQAQAGQQTQRPRVTGRIITSRDVQRQGGEPVRVVLVQPTRGGAPIAVDLGPAAATGDVQVGQTISVRGLPGRVGNRLVFFAENARLGDRQVQVERPAAAQRAVRPEARQIRGNVLNTREVTVQGAGTRNLLALVETEGGQRIVVDLGTVGELGVDVTEGLPVQARGREVRVGDRIVLLANQLRANDQVYDVERAAGRR